MKKFIFTLFLSLIVSYQALAASFTAKSNRNELPAGELFVLILDYSGPRTFDTPDFAPLNNDFTTYSISSSETENISNGVSVYNKRWNVSLISNKTEGTINVPSISIGSLKSNPLTLKINNNIEPESTSQNGYEKAQQSSPKYSIETSVDVNSPYVQQQIRYSIIVRDSGGLQMSLPQFSEEASESWVIKAVSNPYIETKTSNGKSIREIKFDYLIFPQKSGLLKLPDAKIDAYYLTQSKRSDFAGNIMNRFFQDEFADMSDMFIDMFAQKNPVVLRTKSKTIEITPIQSAKQIKWWLPAKDVKIYAKWETPISEFKVGEAISRLITIKAIGVAESQLPNIEFNNVENLKQYPEKPLTQTELLNGDILSILNVSNVYIPTKSGKITIPEIEINWFNVNTKRFEKAIIDATVINVKKNENYIEETSNNETEVIKSEVKSANDTTIESQDSSETINIRKNSNILYLIVLAFIIGLTTSYFIFRPKNKKETNQDKASKIDHKRNIVLSAEKKDFKSLRNNLISWASERFNNENICNLKDISSYINNKEFERELDTISANLYSNDPKDWDAKRFVNLFNRINNSKQIFSKNETILPELYK